jgi:DNA-binding NarL/FixJ family response regulator
MPRSLPGMVTMGERIRVFICDDHAVVREGTRRIFEAAPGFEVVGEAADGEAAVEAAERFRPDVMLLDMRLPGMSGIEATREVRARSPGTAVLVLSAYGDETYVAKVLGAGARGYLLKTARGEELREAVRLVHSGGLVLDQSVSAGFGLPHHGAGQPSQQPLLSRREMEVLRAICRGMRNKQIALNLGLSVRTVEGHVESILQRLEVSSRTEAALVAVSKGWADERSA